jgi:hypothetical protein
MRSSASDGIWSSVNGRLSRSSSSCSSARALLQLDDRLTVHLAQPRRDASSSGAWRTSSSSCLTIEPIRITFAGCSMRSAGLCCREGSTDPSEPMVTVPTGLAVLTHDDDLLVLGLLA